MPLIRCGNNVKAFFGNQLPSVSAICGNIRPRSSCGNQKLITDVFDTRPVARYGLFWLSPGEAAIFSEPYIVVIILVVFVITPYNHANMSIKKTDGENTDTLDSRTHRNVKAFKWCFSFQLRFKHTSHRATSTYIQRDSNQLQGTSTGR